MANPADANSDGKVTAKEQKKYDAANPARSDNEMASEYGYALKIINSNNEIRNLFNRATNDKKGIWTTARFNAALQATDWWAENNQYARTAWTEQALGDADAQAKRDDARTVIQNAVVTSGSQPTAERMDELIHRYMFEGWGQRPGGAALLQAALAEDISAPQAGFMKGASGTLQESLASVAESNGLKLSRDYYESAARSVEGKLTTAEDWDRDVRTQAASLWPTWSEKIMAGSNAVDLASGYINTMSQTLEIPTDTISINDPFIRSAMTSVDDKGNPTATGLWDFQNKLRSDPRWMKTKQATDKVSNIANEVLRSFGYRG